ncbi:hypothetical protein [Planctomycetes bacterium K23_9]|uniref:Uncharacterized protein n=1 Tax=Stieleria marina TaxID=1930275 RepID=A0A517NWW9_9BACT|nr:hypothetical protein K239x_36300 [Planctomycetes bacterium K23_9]
MRQNVVGVLAVLLLAPFLCGCQQTSLTGQSPLTPVQSAGTLSPVRTTSGLGPMGGSLRVPPPPTGGFSVPNNHMGGTMSSNQLGSTQSYSGQPSLGPNPLGPSIGSGLANRQSAPSNIQPSGWVESGSAASGPMQMASSGSFGVNQPLQANAQRPQSGGMRVIDLTQAPAPPGYSPAAGSYQAPVGQFANQSNQNWQGNGFQNTAAQFNNVAPAGFNSQSQANFNSPVANAFQQTGVNQGGGGFQQAGAFRPSTETNSSFGTQFISGQPTFNGRPSETIASVPRVNQLMPSQIQTREFELKPSPLAPSFSGVSNFEDKPPSTEPIGSGFQSSGDNLPWRRPDMQ